VKKIKNILQALIIVSIAIIFLEGTKTYSQCQIQATAFPNVICAGDAVSLSSVGGCGYLMKNDFNLGTIGIGWSSTAANPVFTNPCGAGPLGLHCWVGTTSSQTRTLVTVNYNVSVGNCTIEWDMRYGRVQGSGNCEDPDAPAEGVHLQYSLNGFSWSDFPGPNVLPIGTNSTTGPFITTTPGSGGYWTPVQGASGQSNHPLYFWHRYSCMVPPVASIANAKFRWAQLATSNQGWDAWGIDEVEIVCPTGAVNILWTPVGAPNDTLDTVYNPGAIYPPQHPNNIPYDTCFVVKVCDTVNSATDTVCIHVNPIPTSDFTISDTSICEGEVSTITYTGTATSNGIYTWDFGGISQSQQGPHTHTFSPAGTHSISLIVNEHGCISTPTIKSITVHPTPMVSFSANPMKGCEPLTVDFIDGSMPNIQTWNWDFGDGNTSTTQNPTNTYVSDGSYGVSLNVSTIYGCTNSISIPGLIKVDKTPQAFFEAVPPVTNLDNPTIQFNDKSNDAATWSWDFGDGSTSSDQNPEHTFNEGKYTVCLLIESSDGCLDSICKEVMVVVDEIEIPNIITPNGDGLNDVFHIKNADKLEQATLIIYNRWGKKVFEVDHYQNNWDGENCSDGVYYYVLKYETYFREDEIHGTVTIIRN